MHYTISQVAKKYNLTAYTLRYYDKENILTAHKTEKGIRYFTESDLEQLDMVCCLKNTGMPIKDIKRYFELCAKDDETLDQRMEIFTEHKKNILKQLDAFKNNLKKIDNKIIWYKGYISSKKEK